MTLKHDDVIKWLVFLQPISVSYVFNHAPVTKKVRQRLQTNFVVVYMYIGSLKSKSN